MNKTCFSCFNVSMFVHFNYLYIGKKWNKHLSVCLCAHIFVMFACGQVTLSVNRERWCLWTDQKGGIIVVGDCLFGIILLIFQNANLHANYHENKITLLG